MGSIFIDCDDAQQPHSAACLMCAPAQCDSRGWVEGRGADLSEFRKVKDWNSWGGSADLDQRVGRSSVKVYSQAIKHRQFVRTSWKCLMVKVCEPLCSFSHSIPFIFFYNQPARILHVFWVKIEINWFDNICVKTATPSEHSCGFVMLFRGFEGLSWICWWTLTDRLSDNIK